MAWEVILIFRKCPLGTLGCKDQILKTNFGTILLEARAQAHPRPLSLQWEPVQYFNNQIICDLVEERHRGIMSILVRERARSAPPSWRSHQDLPAGV